MKRIVLTLTAVLIFGWNGLSFASSSVDALIQKLKDKGILTDQDAVQLKGEIPAQQVHAVRFGRVLARADGALELRRDLRHVAHAHRRVHRADVDHAPAFRAMQPRITVQRLGLVKPQNEIHIIPLPRFRFCFAFGF